MLAFSVFCDAHFHLAQCAVRGEACAAAPSGASFFGCSCAHDREEFLAMERQAAVFGSGTDGSGRCARTLLSFGLHPQSPLVENGAFLEGLLQSGRLDAVGEAGIDFFTPEFRADAARQEEAWRVQLELSARYKKPLVIHCRKALDVMFRDARQLRDVPAAVFHSFCGGMNEANALLSRNINAYFSFGKQVSNGRRRSVSCVESLPVDRLLLETDAPFQTLKGEPFTPLSDIRSVYEAAYLLRTARGTFSGSADDFARRLLSNFQSAFLLPRSGGAEPG